VRLSLGQEDIAGAAANVDGNLICHHAGWHEERVLFAQYLGGKRFQADDGGILAQPEPARHLGGSDHGLYHRFCRPGGNIRTKINLHQRHLPVRGVHSFDFSIG